MDRINTANNNVIWPSTTVDVTNRRKRDDRGMDGRKEEGQIQKKQYLIPFDLGNMEDTVNKMSNNMT